MSYKTFIDAAAWELYDQVRDDGQEERIKAVVTALVTDCVKAERERVLAEVKKQVIAGLVALDDNSDASSDCAQIVIDVCTKLREVVS